MSNWNKMMECVPDFSEGRDLEKIEKIIAPFRAKSRLKLLDCSNDLEFEGMANKIKLPDWWPGFVPAECHLVAGAVAVGACVPVFIHITDYTHTASFYWGLENFSLSQVLGSRIME